MEIKRNWEVWSLGYEKVKGNVPLNQNSFKIGGRYYKMQSCLGD